jgi:sec-independent protein translocase protein TatA
MFDFSPVQIIIVLIIALLVFGPRRLPDMGRSLGRGMREFKDSISGVSPDRPVSTPADAPAAALAKRQSTPAPTPEIALAEAVDEAAKERSVAAGRDDSR